MHFMSPSRISVTSALVKVVSIQKVSRIIGVCKLFQAMNVEKWDSSRDGDLTISNMEKKLEKQGYKYTKYTFPPGTDFPDHTHDISKKDAIMTGRFEFQMYGEMVVMEPGDMVEVPKNTVHNARVVGNENVVFLDATK